MLGLPEYLAASAEVQQLGKKYDSLIGEALEGVENKAEAIRIAKAFIPRYRREYERVLKQSLYDVAWNAAEHYKNELGLERDSAALAKRLVVDHFTEKYYGASLQQRLAVREKQLTRTVTQTAQVNIQSLSGLFTEKIPFGAQSFVDRRILQGAAVKIEQNAAREAAKDAEAPLIRWTLSPRHAIACDCEELASAVSDEVVTYLKANSLTLDPKGLYLAANLPNPPHPNCQCEYGIVTAEREHKPTNVQRVLKRVRSIIRRIRGK